MSFWNTIKTFARRPDDSDETAFFKILVLVVALSCCGCGLVWSALYATVFGIGLTMALPFAFVVIVGTSIIVSAIIKDHRPMIYSLLTCITWISALIQWSIGSSVDSGLVICWSFLGPIGALMFLSVRQALVWMAMFVIIIGISFGLEPALQGTPLPVSDSMRAIFLSMNMGTASIIVFATAGWFVRSIQKALSDLKEAQILLIDAEKQAVVGRLVSGILHEMNTPLGAIRSSTDTMGRALKRCEEFVFTHAEMDNAEGKRALSAIATVPKVCQLIEISVERLSSVVNGLARFVSLDEAEKKLIDVRQSLDTALALLSDSIKDRIQVMCHYDEHVPNVLCFPAKLNQVLFNILQNAIQSIEGKGKINVSVATNNKTIFIEISDTGRGIPASQLASVFEINFTKQSGKIRMKQGLPISKRHLDEISGKIIIESKEGEGTIVGIELLIANSQKSI